MNRAGRWPANSPQRAIVTLFYALPGMALLLLLTACSTGAYPLDVFPEMHYQPSYRSQEPPRLSPSAQSVPVTGKEVLYDFAAAGKLPDPMTPTPENLSHAAQLFRTECSFCHGPAGRGDGPMVEYFRQQGVTPPLDLASLRVRARQPGELYWLISNGIGSMPAFGRMLTPEQRWLLVLWVTSVGRQ